MRVSYLGSTESITFIPKGSVRIPFYSRGSDSSLDEVTTKKKTTQKNAATTFFVRALGESTENIDINAGDVLVVDRALTARHGDTVITCEKGKMEVVTLELKEDVLFRPKNKAYSSSAAITVEASSLEVFGVVASVVRKPS
ncbi:S24 family peptidase [Marinomonas colpomeniae]|uniref:UV protection and mutation protein n=1 Tax=Marinomonas colpomeniae TaxID=2774408 RepID=A0ABR8P0Z3_9GAMM|nr:S24 family peptidase [Marinomonas colpomeniae]MBD5771961.1 UV protection and mutation protein [Marinomonas colpomeniae]